MNFVSREGQNREKSSKIGGPLYEVPDLNLPGICLCLKTRFFDFPSGSTCDNENHDPKGHFR